MVTTWAGFAAKPCQICERGRDAGPSIGPEVANTLVAQIDRNIRSRPMADCRRSGNYCLMLSGELTPIRSVDDVTAISFMSAARSGKGTDTRPPIAYSPDLASRRSIRKSPAITRKARGPVSPRAGRHCRGEAHPDLREAP